MRGTVRDYCRGRNKKLIDLARRYYGSGADDVKVMPGNEEIWNILTLASTQWRAGFGGAYGLDYNVIIEMAKSFDVDLNQSFFEKLKAFEDEVLKIWKDKGGKDSPCDEDQKGKCEIEFGEFIKWACKNCKKMKKGKDEDDPSTSSTNSGQASSG